MRRALHGIVVSALLGFTCLALAVQEESSSTDSVVRPNAATRYVGSFDFEEAAQTTQPVPPHWLRVLHNPPVRDLPDFPSWNDSRYDDTFASSGSFSMKLPVRGGSTRLRLSGGVLPALPDADYAVSVSVRTQGLVYARARVVVRFLDETLTPVPDAYVASELLRAETGWKHINLELPGRERNAAWIQIDLEVLQPAVMPGATPDKTRILRQDFDGAAWFDDVQIRQLPRIMLRTNSPGNVVFAPDTPALTATVRDLTGESLRATIRIYDIDEVMLSEYTFLGVSHGEGVEWRPKLPRFGWYRAELRIESDGKSVAQTDLPFVWAPTVGREPLETPSRFGISLNNIVAGQFHVVEPLVESLGAGSVHVPVWDIDASLADHLKHLNELDAAVEGLLNSGKRVTLTMPGIPRELAAIAQIDPRMPLLLTDVPTSRWAPYLDPVLTRFGQRVTQWQPGSAGLDLYHDLGSLSEYVSALYEVLAHLSPEPSIVLPWQAVDRFQGPVQFATRSVFVPSWLPPRAVESLLELSKQRGSQLESIVLGNSPLTDTSARARVADVVKRAVFSSHSDANTILLEQPWGWTKQQPILKPEFAAWRTVIDQLSDRHIVGMLPMPDGAFAAIMSGSGGGAIVAWNEWADPKEAVVDEYLGQGTLTIHDVFGNKLSVNPDSAGNHHIQLHSMPIIITGINTNISLFRSLFRVEPSFVISLAARHELEITLTNPWPLVISGTIRIQSPEAWDMTPRSQTFIIEPHGTRSLPVAATIGVGGEAGIHDVVAQIDLQADTKHPVFKLSTQVEVGLENVQLTATARRSASTSGGVDNVIVSLLVRNTSDSPLTMNAFAIAPSFPRQQAPVSNVPPGASIVRQFVFPHAADTLRDAKIRVGVEAVGGPLRLNKTITLD
jgi:hypothetical protein